jgi:hypothetical protein
MALWPHTGATSWRLPLALLVMLAIVAPAEAQDDLVRVKSFSIRGTRAIPA